MRTQKEVAKAEAHMKDAEANLAAYEAAKKTPLGKITQALMDAGCRAANAHVHIHEAVTLSGLSQGEGGASSKILSDEASQALADAAQQARKLCDAVSMALILARSQELQHARG